MALLPRRAIQRTMSEVRRANWGEVLGLHSGKTTPILGRPGGASSPIQCFDAMAPVFGMCDAVDGGEWRGRPHRTGGSVGSSIKSEGPRGPLARGAAKQRPKDAVPAPGHLWDKEAIGQTCLNAQPPSLPFPAPASRWSRAAGVVGKTIRGCLDEGAATQRAPTIHQDIIPIEFV